MITGPLFPKLYSCDKKFICLQGGGDSGKTSTTLQYLAIKAIEEPKSIITITGRDLPNLKGGPLRLFQNYIEPEPEIKPFIKTFNKTENTFYFTNGSIIEFKGFDNELDARGSERDYLFINECNSRTYDLFWQLQRKTRKKVIVDYNPSARFWVHDKLLSGEEKAFVGKVQLYITDHRHNPFLSQEDHEAYENISDPELFKVYSRGQLGKVKGLIFGHFKEIDAFPTDCTEIIYGLDFGFTNDPTALTKVGINGRKRFVQKLTYEAGIQPEEILKVLKASGHANEPIYCDHEKNIISQLRRLRLPAVASIKGPGSIAAGISKVRSYECYYVKDEDFKKEIENYKFTTAQDLVSGKEMLTNIPMSGWDHICDSLRMAIYSHSFRRLEK